jgi:hypothetical protein
MARTIDQMTKISKEAYDTLSNSELQILEQAIQTKISLTTSGKSRW